MTRTIQTVELRLHLAEALEFGFGGAYVGDYALIVFPSREHAAKACDRYWTHVRESEPAELQRMPSQTLFTPDSWTCWRQRQTDVPERTWAVDNRESDLMLTGSERAQLSQLTHEEAWVDERYQPVAYLRRLTIQGVEGD